MQHIFLSYSSADRARVQPLIALLGQIAPVWWDQRIMHGTSWDEQIEQALEDASCVVVVWTGTSVDARWVKAEARYAVKHRIILPVRLDPVDPPIEFSDVETALLEGWDGSPEHPEAVMLKESVAAIIAHGRPTPAPRPTETPAAPAPVAAAVTVPQPRATEKRTSSFAERLAIAAVVGTMVVGGTLIYRNRDDVSAPVRPKADTVVSAVADTPRRPTTDPGRVPAFRVQGIIVSETQTRTLEQALQFLDTDSERRGYHYLVDVDGRVYSYFNERRRARHTAGQNATTLGIGMVHVLGTTYGDRQVDGLVALLTTLAHDYDVDVPEIKSKGEVDRTRPKDITARMAHIRRRVAALLGEWRVGGPPPAGARPRAGTPPPA